MKVNLGIKTFVDKKKVTSKALNVLWRSSNKIVELAKIRCPVDTGRLRATIHINPTQPNSLKFTISDGVDYGVHQEYGTSKMAAQPFFRPSLDEVKVIWVPLFWKEELNKP